MQTNVADIANAGMALLSLSLCYQLVNVQMHDYIVDIVILNIFLVFQHDDIQAQVLLLSDSRLIAKDSFGTSGRVEGIRQVLTKDSIVTIANATRRRKKGCFGVWWPCGVCRQVVAGCRTGFSALLVLLLLVLGVRYW